MCKRVEMWSGLEGKVVSRGQGPLCQCTVCVLHKGACQGGRGGWETLDWPHPPGGAICSASCSTPSEGHLFLMYTRACTNGPYTLVASLSRSPNPAPLSRVPPHLQRGNTERQQPLCFNILASLAQDKVLNSKPGVPERQPQKGVENHV